MLYPLEFTPIFKYRIWGGDKLKNSLNKPIEQDKIGESWEISSVKGDETKVAKGILKGYSLNQLIEEFGADFLGQKVLNKYGKDFPLLIKFIDAAEPLSIQVHPNDDLAKERHNSFGKNEMWYVMEASNEAEIIVGFNRETSQREYAEKVSKNEILSLLNVEKAKKGAVFNIPTGRIHAIGAGVLLAEIQQTSDVTYRIYDYDRVEASTGKTRELHNELALEAIDYSNENSYETTYETIENEISEIIETPYFNTRILELKNEEELTIDFSKFDSFIILMAVSGDFSFEHEMEIYKVSYGHSILIPNQIKKLTFLPKQQAKLLVISC